MIQDDKKPGLNIKMPNKSKCQWCREGQKLPFEFTMAFQPIVDLRNRRIWGYEALVRGITGESAASILSRVTEETLYQFDQACRVRAISFAGALLPRDGTEMLSINFKPNAVYEPAACIRASLEAAEKAGFRRDRLMFEFTEDEKMADTGHIATIISEYKRLGFLTALDDFGAGYAGLGLLAKIQTDLIKIDMDLVRNIHKDPVRQTIVAGICTMARALGITVIAEGIESAEEAEILLAAGISLFQGYYFARPQLECFPGVDFGGSAQIRTSSAAA